MGIAGCHGRSWWSTQEVRSLIGGLLSAATPLWLQEVLFVSISYTRALVRKPASTLGRGITTATLGEPDYPLALSQYRAYVTALTQLGLACIELCEQPAYPDAHFIEDTAIVLAELAVITRPGALARRGEQVSVKEALAAYRPIHEIEEPGTLEGGDVFVAGSVIFVGLSERTNESGLTQLAEMTEPHGYTCQPVVVGAGLHLKSSVNLVGPNRLIVTEALADNPAFDGYEKIIVPLDEAPAANCLLINGTILMPSGYPHTRKALSQWGKVIELGMSEMEKMDGGLTCLSLRF